MARFQQSVSEPWNEKLRLIRFRMAKERLRFSDEIRLIPGWLVALMIVLFVIAEVTVVTLAINHVGPLAKPAPLEPTSARHGMSWPQPRSYSGSPSPWPSSSS